MKTILISIITLLFFIGCGASKQKEVSLPTWYLNPPANNPIFIFGEGMGDTLDDAKANALNNMAAKLVVAVSSSIKSYTATYSNGNASSYDKSITKQVQTDVEKIKFNNAKVEKSLMAGKNFIVLMKVDREELYRLKKQEFLDLDSRIDSKYNNASTFPQLEKIYALQSLQKKINEAKSKSYIVNAIKNSFQSHTYISKYDSYIDEIATLKTITPIYVQSNMDENYFKDELITLLNTEQFKVSNDKNSPILIDLNNKVRYSIARGWNIAKVTNTVTVKSNNKTISNNVIQSLGRSSSSKENALNSAAIDFSKKLKKHGVEKILFSK
ncbi:MAG TPA: hypothetical protein ENK66_03055 [Arcobacter sp.]|jgi:hypothetical protein|nr:hypothetical protein [Arcobacter sp.]